MATRIKKTIHGIPMLVEYSDYDVSLYVSTDIGIFSFQNFGTYYSNYRMSNKGLGRMMRLLKRMNRVRFELWMPNDHHYYPLNLSDFTELDIPMVSVEDFALIKPFFVYASTEYFVKSADVITYDMIESIDKYRSWSYHEFVCNIEDSWRYKTIDEMTEKEKHKFWSSVS